VDISPDMLKGAEFPVRQSEISAGEITLMCQNIYLTSFPCESFDFIYSLGMFGHGSPVTGEICQSFYEWLKPNGKIFFNVVALANLKPKYRLRRRLRRIVEALLPTRLRERLSERRRRLPFFGMTRRELHSIMKKTSFTNFAISSHICDSPLWRGVLLECIAGKP
jgi:SAM-dependent methyltransferase